MVQPNRVLTMNQVVAIVSRYHGINLDVYIFPKTRRQWASLEYISQHDATRARQDAAIFLYLYAVKTSYKKIGERIGISGSRVNQIVYRALRPRNSSKWLGERNADFETLVIEFERACAEIVGGGELWRVARKMTTDDLVCWIERRKPHVEWIDWQWHVSHGEQSFSHPNLRVAVQVIESKLTEKMKPSWKERRSGRVD